MGCLCRFKWANALRVILAVFLAILIIVATFAWPVACELGKEDNGSMPCLTAWIVTLFASFAFGVMAIYGLWLGLVFYCGEGEGDACSFACTDVRRACVCPVA